MIADMMRIAVALVTPSFVGACNRPEPEKLDLSQPP